MRCKICGQGNVDGAIDQFGDYVCIDCFANGEAHFRGREAQVLTPAPDVFGSTAYARGLNHRRVLDAYNGKR